MRRHRCIGMAMGPWVMRKGRPRWPTLPLPFPFASLHNLSMDFTQLLPPQINGFRHLAEAKRHLNFGLFRILLLTSSDYSLQLQWTVNKRKQYALNLPPNDILHLIGLVIDDHMHPRVFVHLAIGLHVAPRERHLAEA